MALTFSYKLVQASDATAATAGEKKGKGKNNNDVFQKGKGNTKGKKGVALDDASEYGVLDGTAGQSIEIYGNGTELDQSRTYWLEVYASDADANNVTLESLDLSLNFNTNAFSSVNGFQYADAFDLMRQSSNENNILRFQQGSADNLKTFTPGNGKGGATDPHADVGTGIALSSTESFVGRVEVEVNDSFFHEITETAGQTRTSAGVIGNYIGLDINIDETVLVTKGSGKNSLQTLREYGGNNGNEYSVIDGVNDGVTTLSTPNIEFVTGDFSSDVSAAFDNFRTTLTTTTGDETNLVREGQLVDGGSFTVSNVGQAGLTDINMTWSRADETGIKVDFNKATVANGVDAGNNIAHDIADNGDGTFTFGTGTNAQLERGLREVNSGGVTDASETLTVDYSATVNGAAGTVAKVDFSDLKITSSGEAAFDVFGANSAVIKNIITYKGDVSYDGKVGMFDLAVLNEAKSQLDNGATGDYRHANADHTGGIDIEDLKILADDWGKSLWQTDTGWQSDITHTGLGDDASLGEQDFQNAGHTTAQTFESDVFNNEGSLSTPSEGEAAPKLLMGVDVANVADDATAYA